MLETVSQQIIELKKSVNIVQNRISLLEGKSLASDDDEFDYDSFLLQLNFVVEKMQSVMSYHEQSIDQLSLT